MYVETAGGVHSPTLSGTTQLDSYRPLFLPTILIGDSRLGGISSTISSYESLVLRGYIVDAILLFRDEYYRNWEYLSSYFAEKGVQVHAVDPPPAKHTDNNTNIQLTEQFYWKIVPSNNQGTIFDTVRHLDICHTQRLEELDSMPRRTLDTIWWPFVQHGHVKTEKDVTVIDSASGDVFSLYNGHNTESSTPSLLEPQFDGSASWWTQAVGHAHPALTMAAAQAAGRYGHVMFPEATHLPALKLAERLVKFGPGRGWASRAFFSDDGSTGMEVALKMALRAFAVREQGGLKSGIGMEKRRGLGVLGLKGSYHGDTIGAMDACEEGVYTSEWHEAKGFWLDPPTISVRNGQTVISVPPSISAESEVETQSLGWTYDITERFKTPLAAVYRQHIESTLRKLRNSERTLAALVLEPIVMGAGGMIFVDPLFQRILIDVVRSSNAFPGTLSTTPGEWSGLPVIFDEVFVGLYRLGFESIIPLLGVFPDISVNAKILTGGLVPMAVTLASDSIFKAFYSEKKVDALLHGHSYTAYPVGCEVANEALNVIEKLSKSGEWEEAKARWASPQETKLQSNGVWSFWDPDFVSELSKLPCVGEVMTLGTVLSIKIADDTAGYQSHSAQKLLDVIKSSENTEDVSPIPGGSPFGINYRTLGNVAYFMLSLNTAPEIVKAVENRIWRTLSS
ncbi:unnamed protein product [Somion occarium]